MGFMDNMKSKMHGMMESPEQRAKLEQMARDKGISIDAAREHMRKMGRRG